MNENDRRPKVSPEEYETNIISEFKRFLICYECSGYFTKFRQCLIGHAICDSCSSREEFCYCGVNFRPLKCTLLENIIECIWKRDKIFDNISRLLECIICYSRITPPVDICDRGHAVCQRCRLKITDCPLCKGPFSDSKNLLLDDIVSIFPYRCQYREKGCLFTGRYKNIIGHESDCRYRDFDCKFPDCQFRGYKIELIRHVNKYHGDNYVSCVNKGYFKFRIKRDDIETGSDDHFVMMIKIDRNLFWFYYTLTGLGLHFGVQIVGDKDQADSYTAMLDNSGRITIGQVREENCLSRNGPITELDLDRQKSRRARRPYTTYERNYARDGTATENYYTLTVIRKNKLIRPVSSNSTETSLDRRASRFFTQRYFNVLICGIVTVCLLYRKPRFLFGFFEKIDFSIFNKFNTYDNRPAGFYMNRTSLLNLTRILK